MSWESATIGFWFTDLLDRHAQFTSWLNEGRPTTFWMTGFFNPQGFLTAMRQEITRAHKGWALDTVVLENDVTKLMKEDINSPPSEGKFVKTSRAVSAKINAMLFINSATVTTNKGIIMMSMIQDPKFISLNVFLLV
jgi:Dynein heavy chain C-terminal domain